METSRSDERERTVDLTLGERMVMAARMMAAEHIRQIVDEAGLDMAEIQRELRERVVRQDLFEPPAKVVTPFADAAPIALPQRVKAKRRPPSQTIAAIDAEIDAAVRERREAA